MKKYLVVSLFLLILAAWAEAENISGVNVRQIANGYSIFLKSSDKMECKIVPQDNALRVVFDCRDAKYKLSQKTLNLDNNPMLTSVTFLEHSKAGVKATQVVVELKTAAQYSLEKSPKDAKLKGVSLNLTFPQKASPPKETVALAEKAPAPELVIGPEDLVEVSVFEMPQFNVTTRVSGDGTITMPLIGNVDIRGLSKAEAEKKIVKELNTKYAKDANVSLQIKEYKSKQVSILGAVVHPGPYYILSRRSLLQILSDAGGLAPDAGNRCFVFREGSQKIEIDLQDLLNNGNQELNISIIPGDVISIPIKVKEYVYVLGQVKTPGAIEIVGAQTMSLVAAISMAGGLTTRASASNVEIKRKNQNGKNTVMKVDLGDILGGKKEDIALVAGDVVNVHQTFF